MARVYTIKDLKDKNRKQLEVMLKRRGYSQTKLNAMTPNKMRSEIARLSKKTVPKNSTAKKTIRKKKYIRKKRTSTRIPTSAQKKLKRKGKGYYSRVGCANPPPCGQQQRYGKTRDGEACCYKKR